MARYLIDANLPYFFSLWNSSDYIHLKDLNDSWKDNQIWEYAKNNDLIIISKDADFSLKVLYKGAPPKVIHLKFGNLRMKDFHALITKVWPDIEKLVVDYSLVNVYLDRLESIK